MNKEDITLTLKKQRWMHSTQYGGKKSISKRSLKKMLTFDFFSILENIPNKGGKLTYANHKLLSVSSILKPMHEFDLFSVPNDILEQRRYLGSKFMENCLALTSNKNIGIENLNINEQERKHLVTFFNGLLDNKMKILHCEKVITNGCLIGFIDFIVRDSNSHMFILEVKIRNSLQETNKDIFQIMTYCEMVGIPGKLVMIGDSGAIKVVPITRNKKTRDFLKATTSYYKNFGIDVWFDNKINFGG